MRRLGGSIVGLALVFLGVLPSASQTVPEAPVDSQPLVYRQLTALDEGTGGVGQPALSADGTTVAFAIASSADDPTNRIYTIGADGSAMTEVDDYQPNCGCGSWVDISEDGTSVVSTDSMQLRLVRGGGEARTLVDLTSNEMSSIRITASGDRVFFLLARDTAPVDSQEVLQRGAYVVDATGGEPRQVVGPDALADLLGLAPDAIQMLRLQTQALDVSADGSRLVLGTYAGAQQAVFAVNADDGNLRQVLGSLASVQRVSIAGDGSRIAMDVIPADSQASINEISVVAFGGGDPDVQLSGINSGSGEPLQLSGDGSRLLISPQSYLVDTATGTLRQLAVQTPRANSHTDLLMEGMPRATMDDEATRFVYVMRSARCADCPNLQEQLASLDIGPAETANAPTIANATIDPTEIPLNYVSAATVSADIDDDAELIAAGVVALREGRYDVNVARDGVLFDDGQNGDATPDDGVFTNDAIVHVGAEVRDDDTGPRTIRFQVEVEASDGMRHAIAYDAGTLMVVEETVP